MLDLDTAKVSAFFSQRYNWRADKIDEAKGANGKTPDLEVWKETKRLFYCEVKSPRDDWEQKCAEKAVAEGEIFFGGLRNDPTFNRIARQCQKALFQFKNINPHHDFPNVLFLVNHDVKATLDDLIETLTGGISVDSGAFVPTNWEVAKRLRKVGLWSTVDLVIWWTITKADYAPRFVFNTDSSHFHGLSHCFGVDPKEVRADINIL